MRHIIQVMLENESGALSRVVGLFSARAFNIESLTVAPTLDPTLSCVTLVSNGDSLIIEHIIKQLNKLIDVVKVVDLTESHHVERELMLLKVNAQGEQRAEIKNFVDIFSCKIVDVSDKTYVVEVAGKRTKIEAFLNALDPSLILEVVRTGVTGITRGKTITKKEIS